ncbi:MAG: hypothetical protein AAF517_27425 [Planctomycetota bacterium]
MSDSRHDEEFVLLESYGSLEAATSVQIRLEAAGIPALVDHNDSSGALPNFQVVGGIRILVPESRRPEAWAVLEAEADVGDFQSPDDPALLRDSETAVRELESAPRRSVWPLTIYTLALLGVGGYLGVFLSRSGFFLPNAPYTVERDIDGDGFTDEWTTYGPYNYVTRLKLDANFDGLVDQHYRFRRGGIRVSAELDRNFDGTMDTSIRFDELGRTAEQRIDVDVDGKSNVVLSFRNEWPTEIRYLSNDGTLNRREVLEGGLTREAYVRSESGEMVLEGRYDDYGVNQLDRR